MSINSEKDLEGLRKAGRVVARCLQHMQSKLKAGITTAELDAIGGQDLSLHGARSAPQLSYNFPGFTCISVNEEAAHGIPGAKIIKAGHLVNIDVSAELDGYFADTGGAAIVPLMLEDPSQSTQGASGNGLTFRGKCSIDGLRRGFAEAGMQAGAFSGQRSPSCCAILRHAAPFGGL